MVLDLKGRTIHKRVEPVIGQSLLDIALHNGIDWQFSCTRGTCARCRCLVETGRDLLREPSDAEWDRLDEEELEQGYRLGCQAIVRQAGELIAVNKTYF